MRICMRISVCESIGIRNRSVYRGIDWRTIGHKLNSAESLIDDVSKIGSSVSHNGRLHIRSFSFGDKIHSRCTNSLNNDKFEKAFVRNIYIFRFK